MQREVYQTSQLHNTGTTNNHREDALFYCVFIITQRRTVRQENRLNGGKGHMKRIKKKRLLNIIMVVIIAAIVFAGVMTVGGLRGWFFDEEKIGVSSVLGNANGVILATSSVQFYDGETVFDVLKRACKAAGIQLEYSWTPMYDSYYIEGINHLYEFDCGLESGWMYKVNGWLPNYGCSKYTLEDGDAIVWCYTCNGLGADVGGSVY